MPLDPSIAMGYKPVEIESPMNNLAKLLSLQHAQSQSDLAQVGVQAKQREFAETNKLRELLSAPDFDMNNKDHLQRLVVAAPTAGTAYVKNLQETRQREADINSKNLEGSHKRLQMAGQIFGQVSQNPTLENAIAALDYAVSNGIYTREDADKYRQQITANPQSIAQLAQMAYRGALDAKEQLPKIQNVNLGNRSVTQSIDPVTGQVKQVATNMMGVSPDAALSASTQRRGQDMTDARQREANAAEGYSTKPLPAQALKMQNEAIDAIGAATGINQLLGNVERQIQSGKVKFGPVSNLVNQGLNASGMSTEESRNFSSFKSNLEKIRNESLRLNAGVQTDGDAQRAWNELFQNINDTNLVKQRLAEIKSLNNRAVELQKLKVDNVRANYRAAPFDYTKMPGSSQPENNAQPAATKSGASVSNW